MRIGMVNTNVCERDNPTGSHILEFLHLTSVSYKRKGNLFFVWDQILWLMKTMKINTPRTIILLQHLENNQLLCDFNFLVKYAWE